jgi:TonB family protein
MARFYPAEAVKQRTQGEVVMECRVGATGALSACRILRQAPEGAGFGEAVLQMQGLFQMKPRTRDGVAVGDGVVRIPVAFRIMPPPAPQP